MTRSAVDQTLRLWVRLQQYDPTQTTTIRRDYERAVVRRFNVVKQVLREAVDTRDVFGLRPLHVLQRRVGAPVPRAFDFPTDSTKVAEFDKWFRNMVDQNVLDLEEVLAQGGIANLPDTQWQAAFVKQGYTKGTSRTLTRMAKLFEGIPSADLVDSILASPFHRERLSALYTRNFNELRGINQAMSQQISRELTEGLATGIGPDALARRLRDRVDGNWNPPGPDHGSDGNHPGQCGRTTCDLRAVRRPRGHGRGRVPDGRG